MNQEISIFNILMKIDMIYIFIPYNLSIFGIIINIKDNFHVFGYILKGLK